MLFRLAFVMVLVACAHLPKPQHVCLDRLSESGVSYQPGASRPGVDAPVEITGPIAGDQYKSYTGQRLVLDCSLVLSLAQAGEYFREAGATEVVYSTASKRRTIRGTQTPSKHGNGLALDIHELIGPNIGRLTVEARYEQGLGDDRDCVGTPETEQGRVWRTLYCRLMSSGLFRLILTPDYDADHYNHFHVEAKRWRDRR